MPHTGNIRFVNRSPKVLRFPSPRGNRLALAPGEFVTDKYYERFARLVHTGNPAGKQPLIMEYADGTPVGVDDLPEEDGIRKPLTTLTAPQSRRPQATPPPAGCDTACEGACQFPIETSPAVADDINAGMDKPPTDPEPPLSDQPEASETPPTAADTMLDAQHSLEPGIAPPMPSAASTPSPAPAATTASPPPQVNEEISDSTDRATVSQIMEQFDLSDQDVLEMHADYIRIKVGGKREYASRIQLGWTTEHLTAMKSHITKLTS